MIEASVPTSSRRYVGAWGVLAILTLAYTVGFIDRQVLNLLVEPIKADYRLSDLQVSLLQGVAFSLAYMLASPLFGRWVDTKERRTILTGALVVWSTFTACTGLARGFWSLFTARSGTGAAEAGLTPAAWSMLTDTFDARRLPFAFSIFMLGPHLGGGLALLFGAAGLHWVANGGAGLLSLLGGLKPWQATFLLVSLPGFLCAALLLLIREPPRQGDAAQSVPIGRLLDTLKERRSFYLNFYAGMGCNFIPLYALPAWMPSFAMRRFGVGISEVGLSYGSVTLLSGISGVLAGPFLARMLLRMGYRDAALRLPMVTAALVVVCAIGLYFAQSFQAALLAAGLAGFCYSAPASLAASTLQLATPNRMRGMTSAIYVFVTSVSGLMLAPTLVAFMTDHVLGDERRVGESLAIVCAGASLLTIVFMRRCCAAYRRMLDEQPHVG